jgi:hypothetical protein
LALISAYPLAGGEIRIWYVATQPDHATDRLFTTDDPRVQPFVFPVSRLVVDPERFEHDADKPMAAIQGRLPLEGRAPESPQCDLCGD